MKRIIFAVLLLNPSLPVYAGMFSGKQLLHSCKCFIKDIENNEQNTESAICNLYVNARPDTHNSSAKNGAIQSLFCPAENVTNIQVARTLVKYLEEHPENLHYDAEGLTITAYHKAFPCN
jgi:hypothetical protein